MVIDQQALQPALLEEWSTGLFFVLRYVFKYVYDYDSFFLLWVLHSGLSMKTQIKQIGLGCGLLFLLGMVGCETASSALVYRCVDSPAATQSRVLYTPQHRALTLGVTSQSAWYASRNDQQPSVFNGYRTASREQIVIDVYDRQQSYNGRIQNHYNQRTRIRQTTSIVR